MAQYLIGHISIGRSCPRISFFFFLNMQPTLCKKNCPFFLTIGPCTKRTLGKCIQDVLNYYVLEQIYEYSWYFHIDWAGLFT